MPLKDRAEDPGAGLLAKAVKSGVTGSSAQTLTGQFGISIDASGLPAGMKVKAPATDLFQKVELRRGRSMALASEDD